MNTALETEQANQVLTTQLISKDPEMNKLANAALDEYTKLRLREDGIREQVQPTEIVTHEKCDRSEFTTLPCKIYDMEIDSPAAYTVPLYGSPRNRIIRAIRYSVTMQRQETTRMQADVAELGSYNYDVRQVVSDNQIRDLHTEDDRAWFALCNDIVGAANSVSADTGYVQHVAYAKLDRKSWIAATGVMGAGLTRLKPRSFVINTNTIKAIETWGRGEMGGDLSQELVVDGFVKREWHGMRVIATIKQEIVRDGEVFFYADPKFLGHSIALEETTLVVDRDAYIISFFAYRMLGSGIGNSAGVVKATFGVTSGATDLPSYYPASSY